MAHALKARVRQGRLVLDEPTDLPEGAEIPLVVDHSWDDLDEEERTRLHAAIDESLEQAERGEAYPAEDIIRELRSRK
ncbi:MAG: hypothetical protein AB1405_05950 [Bdellovibrionota bacterium]